MSNNISIFFDAFETLDEYILSKGVKCSASSFLFKYHLVEIKKLCNLETTCLGIVANNDSHTGTNYNLCNSPNGLVEDENYDVYLKKFLLGIIHCRSSLT